VLAAALAQSQTLVLDLDADHQLDRVVLTQTQKRVEVTVTYGNKSYPSETFHFPVNPDLEDAVCAVPVELKREGEHGFVVTDNTCDSLHFRFDRKMNKMRYWRL
jgi:hypothetical protein